MSALFRFLQNGLRRHVKEDLPEDPGEMVGLGDMEEKNKNQNVNVDKAVDENKNADKETDENQNKDMDEEEEDDEEVFVLANSQTEKSQEEDNEDELIVLYDKSKEEMETKTADMDSPKRVGDATMTGEVWERMNRQANITSSGFHDTTLAKVLSEATLSPGDNTVAGQMWSKYNAQADATHFQDTSLARVLSDAVPQSPETKSSDGQTGDKTLLWRRYNEQADATHFQDTTLCQILAKVAVSPENKSIAEGKKLPQMGDKTMLNNMWADVNKEGEVTLMGRIEDELGNNETAAAAWDLDLPSPLQSQVTKNVGTFDFWQR